MAFFFRLLLAVYKGFKASGPTSSPISFRKQPPGVLLLLPSATNIPPSRCNMQQSTYTATREVVECTSFWSVRSKTDIIVSGPNSSASLVNKTKFLSSSALHTCEQRTASEQKAICTDWRSLSALWISQYRDHHPNDPLSFSCHLQSSWDLF